MTHEEPGFHDVCPTITRAGSTIGFSPSPAGMHVRVWWRADSAPIGSFTSFDDAGLEAISTSTGSASPTAAEIESESHRIRDAFRDINWYELGF